MLKEIYFYVVDPGALSVMRALKREAPTKYSIKWIADGFASSAFEEDGTKYLASSEFACVSSCQTIILSAQMNLKRTAELISELKQKEVKTGFIFDHWGRYIEHFTLSTGRVVTPDIIFTIDRHSADCLKKYDIDEGIVKVIGHPGIEDQIQEIKKFSSLEITRIKNDLRLKGEGKVILLALEPLSDDVSSDQLVFNEFDVIRQLKEVVDSFQTPTTLVVAPHPRQRFDEVSAFLKNDKRFKEVILIPNIYGLLALRIADLVVGLRSPFLISAAAVGKQIISIQYERKPEAFGGEIPFFRECKISDHSKLNDAVVESLQKEENYIKPIFPTGSSRKFWQEIDHIH